MRHGSLFSGIGGFDLAAEWIGWENVFHCEWNEFGQKILKHYWPKALSYADITKTDFTIHRGNIDILTGGFPCQPYSAAGKRLGKEDDRHLWPEMLRAIREIQPRWVVGENVRGLTNWNGGVVFDEVQADLEAEGYEVLPFLLPACAVNAPHRRDRIWFVAYNEGAGRSKGCGQKANNEGRQISKHGQERDSLRNDVGASDSAGGVTSDPHNARTDNTSGTDGNWQKENERRQGFTQPEFGADSGDASDTSKIRLSASMENGELGGKFGFKLCNKRNTWHSFPTQSPVCGGNDGLPTRLDGITFSKWRNESIKGFGNAIVPQVAYELLKVIEKMNQ